jgi:transposase, IS30 family
MLLHLPNGKASVDVRDALIAAPGTLSAQLRRSLTWDQGKEMSRHREFSVVHQLAPCWLCCERAYSLLEG